MPRKKQFTRIQFNPNDDPAKFAEKLNRLQDQLGSMFDVLAYNDSVFSGVRLGEEDQNERTNTSFVDSQWITASIADDERRDELQVSFELNPYITSSILGLSSSLLNLSSSVTASFLSSSTAFATALAAVSSSFATTIGVLSSSVTSSFSSSSLALTATSSSINASIVSASSVINNLRTPQFVVMTTTTELPNERVLAASDPITRTDGGAGGSVTIGLSSVFSSSLVSTIQNLSNLSASITASIASASTVMNNLRTPQYLTLAATSELPNERVLTPGTLLSGTDGGSGGAYTVSFRGIPLYNEGVGPVLSANGLIDFRGLNGISPVVADFGSGVARVTYTAAALSSSVTASLAVPAGHVLGRDHGAGSGPARPMSGSELGNTIRFGNLVFTSVAPGTYDNYPITSSMNSLFITPNSGGDVIFNGFAVTGSMQDGFEFFLMKEGFTGRVILRDNVSTTAASNRIFTPGGGAQYELNEYNDGVRIRWNGTVWHPQAVRRPWVRVNSAGTGSARAGKNFIGGTGIIASLAEDATNQENDVTFAIDNNVVATISGSRFTGTVSAAADMFCSGTSHFSGSQRIAGTVVMSADTFHVGTLHSSGTIRQSGTSVFSKDVFVSQTTHLSGTLLAGGGITGSISRISSTVPLITVATSAGASGAGRSLSIATGSNGTITITLN